MSKRFKADSAIYNVHIGYLGCQGRDPFNAATLYGMEQNISVERDRQRSSSPIA